MQNSELLTYLRTFDASSAHWAVRNRRLLRVSSARLASSAEISLRDAWVDPCCYTMVRPPSVMVVFSWHLVVLKPLQINGLP